MEDPTTFRVAVPPTAGRPKTAAAALDTIDAWAVTAAAMQTHLLVLPQTFLTDAIGLDDWAGQGALLSDGPELVALASIARRHRVAIACGYVERCSGRFHDAALFVDHRGCALANYRRTHFVPGREPDLLAEGHWLNVVPFADRKLGLLIGPDIEAPEPARALALAGADSLLVLAAHGPDADVVGEVLLPARAYENGCAIVYANGCGDAASPVSRILDPRGAVLAMASQKLAGAALPAPAPAGRVARRPQLYRKLAASIADAHTPRV